MEHWLGTFNPDHYSDVPFYNIQAVAAVTGVPAITLRSWERRYGVPEPRRDPKGYRLYSERDIAITRWLRERVQEGVGISRAVNMLRALERGDVAPDVPQVFNQEALRGRLLDAITRMDNHTIARVLAESLTTLPVEDALLSVVQPVLYSVGEGWAAGRVTVTAEHVASSEFRSYMAQLIRISPAPLRPERFMIGCAPGELHELGALMLALFLRRRGFDVVYAGASVEPDAFIEDARRLEPAGVLLSAMTGAAADALRSMLGDLAGLYHGIIAFGGQAYTLDPALAHATPGCYLGSDAREAVRALESMLAPGIA